MRLIHLFKGCGLLLLASLYSSSSWAGLGYGCSMQQNLAFTQASQVVGKRLNQLVSVMPGYNLQFVYDQFIAPEHRLYVEGSIANANYVTYLDKMQSVFSRMQTEFQRGIEFECKDSNDEPQCQGGETIAYVLFWGEHAQKKMYLCSGFFTKSGIDVQAETVFHELSHYSADTDDLAGNWRTPQYTDIVRAPDDAYHIQQFVSGNIQRLLRNQIWYWNWPKMNSLEIVLNTRH